MIHFYIDKTTSAEVIVERAIQQLQIAAKGGIPQLRHLAIRFSFTEYYLPEQPQLDLLALLSIQIRTAEAVVIEGSVFPFTVVWLERLLSLPDSDDILKVCCLKHSQPWLVMSDPWWLVPTHIPKPWGQEIWYTGIEARGQAEVMGAGGNIPLSWLLELMSERVGLNGSQPILLKVLDPLPDDVYGDLYFELHEEKQEVYVVTHVDQSAWPAGVGAIKLGFSADTRESYQTDQEFKQAYLVAVKAYEQVRRLVDAKLDEKKAAAGIHLEHPVANHQMTKWIKELSQITENKELLNREISLREAMDSFTAKHPLVVGDVVTVPKLVPHALQHGVRVVEFQTPVYERKILSFGQKVLTQPHWDTEAALSLIDLNFAQLQQPETLSFDSHMKVERIVNFDDFEVRRIRLDGSCTLSGEEYSILIVVQGDMVINAAEPRIVIAGQALLIPKSATGLSVSSKAPTIFLLALPR